MRGFEETNVRRHKEIPEEGERRRTESDSDSDGSEGRSLELASSHSSDEEESGNRRHRARNARRGYLPNITEHAVSRCGTPPALNVVTNSQLFPAVKPMYAPRWSSQLPESYMTVPEVGRWSAGTASDNNEFCGKNSPNPLPNPEASAETCVPNEQYVMRANYEAPHYMSSRQASKMEYLTKGLSRDNLNYEDYAERCSESDDKHHGTDKYLFPYTGRSS